METQISIQKLLDTFTHEELLTVLETARFAFADAEIADCIADKMDLEDSEFTSLRDKLQSFLD